MTDQSYRISWIAFVLAVTTVVLTPAIVFFTDDGYPGWDQLSAQLDLIFGGTAIAFLFLLVSFVSGMFAWRRRRVALLWVVPSGTVVLIALAILLASLVGRIWQPNWL